MRTIIDAKYKIILTQREHNLFYDLLEQTSNDPNYYWCRQDLINFMNSLTSPEEGIVK